ncbi:MAG: uroporphyrinogen-III C-methyltransferase [Kiritimatiellia bacterium]
MSELWPLFKVGSRGSPLALVQSREAIALIGRDLPEPRFVTATFATPGDRDKATDLRESDPDFFTRDLHRAVLEGVVDCAVHSAKDLEEPVTPGIDWFWLPSPADPRDAIVLRRGVTLESFAGRGVAGVSSGRREAYCGRMFPGLVLKSVRGTIEERLGQLDAGAYDLLIIAGAALQRLGLESRIEKWIPAEELPAPEGQGHLALTFKAGDARFERLRSLYVKPVVFVGAGPGGKELCTLAGLAALGACDVCLYDALADLSLLEAVPVGALCLSVGKRAGGPSTGQEAICRMLTEYARRGRRVVRLKGGDPGIFGRLAEEVDALDALGLPHRVIPGVSSLNAATTGTGLLLTRRGVARAFTVMTPRQAREGVAPLPEEGTRPLACFMAGGVLPELAADLIQKGYKKETPAACVSEAGLESQLVWSGTLGKLSAGAVVSESGKPVLVLIGETASANYLYKRAGALRGMRVLVTCGAELQDRMAAAVLDCGGIPVRCPLIRLEPDFGALPALESIRQYDWVVLPSPSAAACFFGLFDRAGGDRRRLPKILVPGPGTARAIRERQGAADVEAPPPHGTAALLEAAKACLKKGDTVLRICSNEAGRELTQGLGRLGAVAADCVLYRNTPIRYDQQPACDAVLFASGSAVRSFVANWGVAGLKGVLAAAMGAPTAEALAQAGAAPAVTASEATPGGLVRALAAFAVARDLRRGKERR